jgi:hypothetical protein
MTNCNRLGATLLLIRCSLFPAGAKGGPVPPPTAGTTRIPPAAFAAVVGSLENYLQADGTLQLLFAGAAAPAAPFLLFRLKRSGYSACCAAATPDGIHLSGRR